MIRERRGARPERRGQGQVPVPEAMTHRASAYGIDPDALHKALDGPASVSIRLNPARPIGFDGEPVPWEPMARYLSGRPAFTLDPAFHAGCYYVQEASSMLLGAACRAALQHTPVQLVLDLCAAPGGKSTHLRALLPDHALLLCNEVDAARRNVLLENLWKWGHPGTAVTGATTAAIAALGPVFDLVVVDAPCSGEGMMRRDMFARTQWSPGLVAQCAARQQGIVQHAWESLRPGGVLIYSTCTWEPAENEHQLAALVNDHGAVPLPVGWPTTHGVRIVECNGQAMGAICFPHLVRGEGFFIGAMTKPGIAGPGRKHAAGIDTSPLPDDLRPWVKAPDTLVAIRIGEEWHAVHEEQAGVVEMLRSNVVVHSAGIPVATMKAGAPRPHPALAYSTARHADAFHAVDLSDAQALPYLAGNSMPAKDATGHALAQWNGHALGWLHGAGNRWNNGLPKAWRIRKHIGA